MTNTRWVHKDLVPEVNTQYAVFCRKYPDVAKKHPDMLWSNAKDIVEWRHKCDWVSFQQKMGLGVFAK